MFWQRQPAQVNPKDAVPTPNPVEQNILISVFPFDAAEGFLARAHDERGNQLAQVTGKTRLEVTASCIRQLRTRFASPRITYEVLSRGQQVK